MFKRFYKRTNLLIDFGYWQFYEMRQICNMNHFRLFEQKFVATTPFLNELELKIF